MFVPFILEAQGGFGLSAKKLVRELEKRRKERECHPNTRILDSFQPLGDINLVTAIGFELVRRNARMILDRSPDDEPLIPAERTRIRLEMMRKVRRAKQSTRKTEEKQENESSSGAGGSAEFSSGKMWAEGQVQSDEGDDEHAVGITGESQSLILSDHVNESNQDIGQKSFMETGQDIRDIMESKREILNGSTLGAANPSESVRRFTHGLDLVEIERKTETMEEISLRLVFPISCLASLKR